MEQKDKSCSGRKQEGSGKNNSNGKANAKGKGRIQGGLNGGSSPSASGAGLQKMQVEKKGDKTDDTV